MKGRKYDLLAWNSNLFVGRRRNNLSLRRRTTTAQKDPSFIIDKIVAYILHVQRIQREFEYEPGNIIAMDETLIWNDMVSTTTVNATWKRDVPLKTTGHEKVRVFVILSAKGDDKKNKFPIEDTK